MQQVTGVLFPQHPNYLFAFFYNKLTFATTTYAFLRHFPERQHMLLNLQNGTGYWITPHEPIS